MLRRLSVAEEVATRLKSGKRAFGIAGKFWTGIGVEGDGIFSVGPQGETQEKDAALFPQRVGDW